MAPHYQIAVTILILSILLPGLDCRPSETESRTSIQYLPFYGGAKGQYLEVTIDSTGSIVKEKIVSEESVSSENIVKNRDENLLSKVLGANLQNIHTLSGNLVKLHNIGRKTGFLGRDDKAQFKQQLKSVGETASNLIKLVDEIGDDVDMLFKRKSTDKRQYVNEEEDVGEEGVGIDSPENDDDNLGDVLNAATIAEAKPVGLAVIGENGVAASRPIATAVAVSGVALARPIATAIAGLDPAALGINFQVNNNKKLTKE